MTKPFTVQVTNNNSDTDRKLYSKNKRRGKVKSPQDGPPCESDQNENTRLASSYEIFNMARDIRYASSKQPVYINYHEIMKTIRYDQIQIESEFYKRAKRHSHLEGRFQVRRRGSIVANVPLRAEPYSDMVLFLSMFLNRGTSIDRQVTGKDKAWDDIIIYKKKQYKIKDKIGLNGKPKHLSLSKLARCKPQVVCYLCHLHLARFIIKVDFLGQVPTAMQNIFFAAIIPESKPFKILHYFCYLFTLLWCRKVLGYPKQDVDKGKIINYVKTTFSGHLKNDERLNIMRILKLIENGAPTETVNKIAMKSKLCWKYFDLFTNEKERFLLFLNEMPQWLPYRHQVMWIKYHWPRLKRINKRISLPALTISISSTTLKKRNHKIDHFHSE